jgi:hypothetical protein
LLAAALGQATASIRITAGIQAESSGWRSARRAHGRRDRRRLQG